MGDIGATRRIRRPSRDARARISHVSLPLALALLFCATACHSIPPVDTAPLDHAGMTYDAIRQLKEFNITDAEVAQLAQVRQSGFSGADCVEAVRIFRGRNAPFNAGNTIAGMLRAGMAEDAVFELVKLDQLGLGAGELQAMRLAGLSDQTVLEVARHHAAGQPVLSGASLAGLKNAGLRDPTLFELARRGVPDSQVEEILSLRRHGLRDAEILRHF